MIQVEMSDDVRKYQTKSVGPFTTRQAIFLFIGIVLGALTSIPLPLSWDNKIIVAGLIAAPVGFCGFKKMDGTSFEIFIIRYIYFKYLTPRKRKVITENSYRVLLKQMDLKAEKKKLRRMTKSQQKAYLKNKNRKKVIYSTKKAYKIYR